MKRLKLILSEILRDQRQELRLTAAIYLTVTVCFLSIFVCFRVAEKNKLIYDDADLAARTYPDVFIAASEFSTCGELYSALTEAEKEYGAVFLQLRIKADDMPLYLELEGLGRINDSISLSESGLHTGELTVNEEALYLGSPLAVGDKAELLGRSFTVVSVGNETAIAFEELASLTADTGTLDISVGSIVTEKALSDSQLRGLKDLLRLGELASQADAAETENRSVAADQKLICLLIAGLSVLVILTLFKQAMLRAAPRLGMFRLYGAKNRFVAAFFLTWLLGYILLPFGAALGIYALLDGVFGHFYLEHDAAFSYKIFALAAVALLSLLFTLPQLVGIIRKQPAELAVRR